MGVRMSSQIEIRNFVNRRIRALCEEERRARSKLRIYQWLGWICVGAGIVFPLLAGSTLLASSELVGRDWTRIGGLLALLAAVLTGLHKGFNCERYQTDLRTRLNALHSLAESYQETALLKGPALVAEMVKLNDRLREIRSQSVDMPQMLSHLEDGTGEPEDDGADDIAKVPAS